MDSRITVDVVEPDSTIQVPNTGGVVGGELSIHEMGAIGLGVVALFLIVVGIIVSAMKKKKGHRIFEKNKAFRIGMKKRTIFGIVTLLVLCGAAGLVVKNSAEQKDEVYADEPSLEEYFDNTLTISTSDINIQVELDDENAFSYVSSDVTVKTSTVGGYILYAYADGTDLVNKKTGEKINGMTIPKKSPSGNTLTENSWGFATEKPINQDSAVWHGMPDSLDNALQIKSVNEASPENDKTTLYYGVYVTPDLPYGSYDGSKISYVAIANVVEPDITFVYGGENVYFDEGRTIQYNAVGYAPVCENDRVPDFTKANGDDCEWKRVMGKYKAPVVSEGQSLYADGWFLPGHGLIEGGEEELLEMLNDGLGEEISGGVVEMQGFVLDYFTITYDANGGSFLRLCGETKSGDCTEEEVTSVSIKYYIESYSDNYYALIDDDIVYDYGNLEKPSLLGWSEDPTATYPTYHYGQYMQTSPLMRGMEIKLYAVWGNEPQSQ